MEKPLSSRVDPPSPARSLDDEEPSGALDCSAGARLFDLRRWIHPALLCTAIVLGGADPPGMVVGGLLLLLYLGARLWAARHIRGAARVHARKAQERRVLITGGPFGHVRNPLYLANSAGIAGACMLFGPVAFGLAAGAVSLVWYHFVVRWEESVLTRLYQDVYAQYQRLVPRFIPRLSRPDGLQADPRESYPWARVVHRERGAIGLGILLVAAAVLLETLD